MKPNKENIQQISLSDNNFVSTGNTGLSVFTATNNTS